MTRTLCCLALTCLVSSCAPKATEVVETPGPKPRQNSKVAGPANGELPAEPRVVNPGGMVVPDIVNRLPDRQDMTPTAPPATAGGVIATPPAPRNPVNE